jgi:hypothetical protein
MNKSFFSETITPLKRKLGWNVPWMDFCANLKSKMILNKVFVVFFCSICVFFMSYLLFIYVIFVVYLCYICGLSMSYLWFIYVVFVVYLCHIYGLSMSYLWFIYVVFVVYLCRICDLINHKYDIDKPQI